MGRILPMLQHLLTEANRTGHVFFPMQAAKDAQKKMPPSEMFRVQTDKYSQFDENVGFGLTSFQYIRIQYNDRILFQPFIYVAMKLFQADHCFTLLLNYPNQ